MGGWSFMEPRLRELGYPMEYVGRDASASPATGSHEVHKREQAELVEAAISGEAPHLVRASSPCGRACRSRPRPTARGARKRRLRQYEINRRLSRDPKGMRERRSGVTQPSLIDKTHGR